MFIRKSIVGRVLIALISIQCMAEFQTSLNIKAAWSEGMKPGMQVRLEQASIDGFKSAMQKFLPHYFNTDMNLPKEYSYEFGMFFDWLSYKVEWKNITYTAADLDIKDVKVVLSKGVGLPLIKVDFPALKKWEIDANQKVNTWIMPSDSKVQLTFKDFDVAFKVDLKVDQHGYLDPIVYDAELNFGESTLYHDNAFIAFFMHQWVYFAIVILKNSVYFVGQYIFTDMMGPVMDSALNHYKMILNLPSPVSGQKTDAQFLLDFRNTADPNIQDGFIDFFFVGELMHHNYDCKLEPTEDLDFMNSKTFSQIVISESAANCMVNSMAKAPLGRIFLNKESINDLFKVSNLEFDTSSLAPHMPIFETKAGKNKPMKMDLGFKDINILFGQYDTNLIMTFEMDICFKLDGHNNKCLIHDQLPMVTSMNMQANDDIVMINLLNLKMDLHKNGVKSLPKANTIKMTKAEYSEFLKSFGYWLNHLKKWLNQEMLKEGIFFPWGVDEFYTTLNFKEKQMHVMLEVEKEAEAFFEDNYWVHKFKQ